MLLYIDLDEYLLTPTPGAHVPQVRCVCVWGGAGQSHWQRGPHAAQRAKHTGHASAGTTKHACAPGLPGAQSFSECCEARSRGAHWCGCLKLRRMEATCGACRAAHPAQGEA